jgi:hypothetical protein
MKGLDMSETYTIYAPGTIVRDMTPVMEDHAYDLSRIEDIEPEIASVVEQFFDDERRVKRGRGFAVRFELWTEAEVRFLRREVAYRYDFHKAGRGNLYGNEEVQSGPRAAAAELLRRCDEVLARMNGVS